MHRILSKIHFAFAPWMLFPLACATVVIGAKIWVIAGYGSPTPYWDQWDAEGAILYPKYFDGTLGLSDLLGSHNEHRILVTRLWSLLLLDLEGYWDPILQMLANTTILGAFVALLVVVLRPALDHASWVVLALFTALIYALPFGWESTLAGFHSQWYFLLLFSLAGLLAIVEAIAFTPRWWLALLLLITSYFSLASGAIAACAACAVCILQFVAGRRSGLRECAAIAMLAVVTLLMMLYIPEIPLHAPLKAHSIEQFLWALTEIVSWPVSTSNGNIAILFLAGIIIQAPSWIVSIRLIAQRPLLNDRRWLLVALTGWLVLQAAAIAYGRAVGDLASRYLDVFAVGLPLNLACLLYLLSKFQMSQRRRGLVYGATACWLLLVLFGATITIITRTLPEMLQKRAASQTQTENMRAYLASGSIWALEFKPLFAIPYPSAQRLALIASQPAIRAILPPELVGEASAALAQQRGLARFTGRWVEALKNFSLQWGVLLIPTGLTLFLIGLLGLINRQRNIEPDLTSAPE